MADIELLKPMPDPPLPTDEEEVFDEKAGETLTAEQYMVNIDFNTKLIPQMNLATAQVTADKKAAALSATAANESANTANTAKLAAQKAVTDAGTAGAQQVQLAKDQVALAGQQVQLAGDQVALAAQQAQLATTNGKTQLDATKVVKAETVVIRDQAQMIADAMQTSVGIPSYTNKAGWVFTVKADGTGLEWRPRQRVGEVLQTAGAVDSTFLPLNGGLYLQSAYPELFAKIGVLGAVAGDFWSAYSTTVGSWAIQQIKVGKDGVMLGRGVGTSALYRSTDNGLTWALVNLASALGASSHTMGAFDTDKRGVWIATGWVSGASVFAARSTDNGLTWVAISAAQLPSTLYRCMATDGNGTWHVGTTNQEIRRSIDNGLTWAQVYLGGSTGDIPAIGTDKQGVWVATRGSGVLRSSDNGVTWALVSSTSNSTANYLTTDEKGIWVTVGYAPSGVTVPGIFVSYDNGRTWSRATVAGTGVNDDTAFCVATDKAGAWYVGLNSGKVIRSVDNTLTWQQLSSSTTGFASTVFISSLILQGSDLLALANTGLIRKSLSSTPYDSATLFKLPDLPVYKGVTSYIKAKEAA